MIRWIKRIVLAVIVLLLIAGTIVYINLNSIVRKVVEQQASASLNVPTQLGSARLSIFGGKISLHDLQIGSPPKFTAPQMLTVKGVKVEVNYGQLAGNPIHVKKIVIDRPRVVVEQSGLKFNFQALMDQMPKSPEGKEPMKLIIDELQLNNAEVVFMPGLPGLGAKLAVPIPSVTLKNIGNADGGQNGAAIKDVVMQTITAMTSKAGEAAQVPLGLAKDITKGLGNVAEDLGKALESGGKGIKQGIESLFGGEKKK